MPTDPRSYLIALSLLNGIGNVLARHLMQYFGDATQIFSASRQQLERIDGIGRQIADKIMASRNEALTRAEAELAFIEKNNIRVSTLLDDDYPARLRECPDAPFVFFYKGTADLNAGRTLSIVGTRRATEYGKELTETLVRDLAAICPDLLVVSGLAYGIDICAHRAALKYGLPTVGVLAHGLDRIYPAAHRATAAEMLKAGGLLTDFLTGNEPEREHFLQRNRIIAGLTDATVVVESAERGGALVTADLAVSYARDLFAFPGRVTDAASKGCLRLIATNKAGLITSARDLLLALCWDSELKKASARERQTQLPFAPSEQLAGDPVVAHLAAHGDTHINLLAQELGMPIHRLSTRLFELEMEGLVKPMPGNIYRLADHT